MTRPTEHLDWVTDDSAAKLIAPSAGKKLLGWVSREQPPFQYFNWMQRAVDKWLKFFDMATYDVVVGAGIGCSHATLNAAVADAGLGANLRVLLKDAVAAVNATVTLSKAGWDITAAPGVTWTKGSATTAIAVTAARVTIKGMRFAGFTVAGDKCITFSAAADYGRVLMCNFVSADTEVDDSLATAGRKPLQIGNIPE